MLKLDKKKVKMTNSAIVTNKKIKGFTAIEVVVAITIVGLLAVMARPQVMSKLQNFKLNAAAVKMLSDIRYARELALSRHSTYGIEVNAASNYYQIFSLTGGVKTVLTDPMTRAGMTTDFDLLSQYSGVTIGAVDLCEAGGCGTVDLRFDSFGAPSDSAGTAMASLATVALTAGGVTKTVRIYQQTAFCEVV
jgi:prepilin-type N-terminal cleavage/methylation domain-containing protein